MKPPRLLNRTFDVAIPHFTHVGATLQPMHQPESSQALDLLMTEAMQLSLAEGERISSEYPTQSIEYLDG